MHARAKQVFTAVAFLAAAVVMSAQQGAPPQGGGAAGGQGAGGGRGRGPAGPPFTISSSALTDLQILPAKYGCAATPPNVSPPISWSNAPAATQSFALMVQDLEPRPDARRAAVPALVDLEHSRHRDVAVRRCGEHRGAARRLPANTVAVERRDDHVSLAVPAGAAGASLHVRSLRAGHQAGHARVRRLARRSEQGDGRPRRRPRGDSGPVSSVELFTAQEVSISRG